MTFSEIVQNAEATITMPSGEILYAFSIKDGAGDEVRYLLVDQFERLIASRAFGARRIRHGDNAVTLRAMREAQHESS